MCDVWLSNSRTTIMSRVRYARAVCSLRACSKHSCDPDTDGTFGRLDEVWPVNSVVRIIIRCDSLVCVRQKIIAWELCASLNLKMSTDEGICTSGSVSGRFTTQRNVDDLIYTWKDDSWSLFVDKRWITRRFEILKANFSNSWLCGAEAMRWTAIVGADSFQDLFLKFLSCVDRYATMVVATYVNGSVPGIQPFACHGTRHVTPDPHDSPEHKQERIRKCTSGKGIPCSPEVKGIPFRQSAIHPFLSQVRLLSDVEKSAAGPASFVISRTLFTKFRASWPQLVR